MDDDHEVDLDEAVKKLLPHGKHTQDCFLQKLVEVGQPLDMDYPEVHTYAPVMNRSLKFSLSNSRKLDLRIQNLSIYKRTCGDHCYVLSASLLV